MRSTMHNTRSPQAESQATRVAVEWRHVQPPPHGCRLTATFIHRRDLGDTRAVGRKAKVNPKDPDREVLETLREPPKRDWFAIAKAGDPAST